MATKGESRGEATTELVRGDEGSLPLVKRMMTSQDAEERQAGFDAAYRMGPAAIELLAEMLRDRRVANRRAAVDLLIDMAPETEAIQGELCAALKDRDAMVVRDAARALGALGERGAPSVRSLIEALSHRDAEVRIYSAEALASIGARAAPATDALAELLHDRIAGVRWAACEGLASIGVEAAQAAPRLVEALKDESLYVRICAAGALGNIGPGARGAVGSLEEAAKDPVLHDEARWAIDRIAGGRGGSEANVGGSSGPAGTPLNEFEGSKIATANVTPAIKSLGNPPVDWDIGTGWNLAARRLAGRWWRGAWFTWGRTTRGRWTAR
jgi:hypothetical protein